MSRERSRPWQNPTPLIGFVPEWLGQFDTFDDWVSHASRALIGLEGNLGEEIKAICVDAKGRRCHIGGDFMRARDEGAFPIRYFVTGSVEQPVIQNDRDRLALQIAKAIEAIPAQWPQARKTAHAQVLIRDALRGEAREILSMTSGPVGGSMKDFSK